MRQYMGCFERWQYTGLFIYAAAIHGIVPSSGNTSEKPEKGWFCQQPINTYRTYELLLLTTELLTRRRFPTVPEVTPIPLATEPCSRPSRP